MKMKIAAVLISSFAATAFAAPATDCVQLAMKSQDVMVDLKKMYEKYAFQTERRAIALCSGATDAEAPIACFKDAMANPEILKATKEQFAAHPFKIENEVIELCHP